LSESAGRT